MNRINLIRRLPQIVLLLTAVFVSQICTTIALVVAADKAAVVSAADAASTDLLSGNDLSKHWTTKGNWSLDADGVVSLKPRPGESGWTRYDSYLWLNKEYKDFDAQFEYKVEKGGNSGFYFNVSDKADPVTKGIEVQLYDSHGKDKLTDHTSGGIIPAIPPTKNAAKPAGEWNQVQVIRKGDNLTVKLNGEVVNEIKLDHEKLKGRPASGAIGFQDHGLPLALRKMSIRGN